MGRRALRSMVAAAAVCAALRSAQAEDTAPEGDPPEIQDDMLETWDLARLKAGEWVKYEVSRTGGTTVEIGYACVRVDAISAWIEMESDGLVLLRGDLKTRKVTEAWWKLNDGPSRPLKVQAAETSRPGKISGSARIIEEIVETAKDPAGAKSREIKCETMIVEGEFVLDDVRTPAIFAIAVSGEVPFVPWWDDKHPSGVPDEDALRWEGKRGSHGGLVRRTQDVHGCKITTKLRTWGKDAEARMKLPDEDSK